MYRENHSKLHRDIVYKESKSYSESKESEDEYMDNDSSDCSDSSEDADPVFNVKDYLKHWEIMKKNSKAKKSNDDSVTVTTTLLKQLSAFKAKEQNQLTVFAGDKKYEKQIPVLKDGKPTKKFRTIVCENVVSVPNDYSGLGSITSKHYLLKNKDNKDIGCFFCRQFGQRKRTRYSCAECGRGYHVNCFTAFHYEHAMDTHKDLLCGVIETIETCKPEGNRNKTKACRRLHEIEIKEIEDKLE